MEMEMIFETQMEIIAINKRANNLNEEHRAG